MSTSIASAPRLHHEDVLKTLLRFWLTPLSSVAYCAIEALGVCVVEVADDEIVVVALITISRSSTISGRTRAAIFEEMSQM